MSNKCPVCGNAVEPFDSCDVCEWEFNGIEDTLSDEEQRDPNETSNPMSLFEARRLYSQGKDVYGNPLPKK